MGQVKLHLSQNEFTGLVELYIVASYQEQISEEEMDDDTVTLAQNGFGVIQRCRCHAYYLTLGKILLQLSGEQFNGLMALFNSAWYQAQLREKGLSLLGDEEGL